MRFFGINQGRHDGGIACFDENGELLIFSQSERLSRKKADCDVGNLAAILKAAGIEPVRKGDLFFNTWPRHYRNFYDHEVWPKNFMGGRHRALIPQFNAARQVHFLNHHMCHVASSWMFRETETPEESLYIALDGNGFREDGTENCYSVGVISPTTFREQHFKLLRQQFSPHERLDKIFLPNTHFTHVAGKLMGLAGYVPQHEIRRLPHTHDTRHLSERIKRDGLTKDLMAECASAYQSYIQDLKEHLGTELAGYPHRSIVVGGGAFLALELNTWLVEQGKQLIFGPPTDDSGIALGSAAYGYFLVKGRWPKRISTAFLQWHPNELRQHYFSPAQVTEFLLHGEIVGLLTGKGEAGPRALGNRSLLALPTRQNAHRVSVEIKGREFYRPVAPVVTDRDAANWFYGPPGRYMQFRNLCTARAMDIVPGVVHHDNSARAQVLQPDDHPWLYELLTEVGKHTSAECLINTSLNGRGRPICNTLADAVEEISGNDIRVVSF
jgi:predicted NodU family carbamoyl transferase